MASARTSENPFSPSPGCQLEQLGPMLILQLYGGSHPCPNDGVEAAVKNTHPVLLARGSKSGSAITLSRTSCAGSWTVISGLPR